MPIESEIRDWFKHSRCLNDPIDPFYMIGLFWDHFGTILGPFWDHFGTTLGPFRDHFGTIVGQLRDHFGTTLQPLWDHFVTNLWPFWDHFRTTLGLFRDHFGTISGQFNLIISSNKEGPKVPRRARRAPQPSAGARRRGAECPELLVLKRQKLKKVNWPGVVQLFWLELCSSGLLVAPNIGVLPKLVQFRPDFWNISYVKMIYSIYFCREKM